MKKFKAIIFIFFYFFLEIVIPEIISAKIKISPNTATYKTNKYNETKVLEILFKEKGDYEVSFE